MTNDEKIKYCGLFGGSFDPPHAGHLAVSNVCLKALSLHEIWWVIAPTVPMKPQPCFSFKNRLAMVQKMLSNESHGRAKASTAQKDANSVYTLDMVHYVQNQKPDYRFCLIMGADNFLTLHTWHNWKELCKLLPIVAVSRPGFNADIVKAVAAKTFSGRIYDNVLQPKEHDEKNGEICEYLFNSKPPRWIFLNGLGIDVSSSGLKKKKRKDSHEY